MNITRDVILDLLPAYFAGEVSADTRAVVEEFFAADPDFRRMAERLGTLSENAMDDGVVDEHTAAEPTFFDRARKRLAREHEARAFAVAYGLGALLALTVAFVRGGGNPPLNHPGVIIALVFGLVALASWVQWRRLAGRRPSTAH